MGYKILNDGAVIHIENGTKTILVSKEQVKTIDTIQNNIVRIDNGEGPLKNIFINYQDVDVPVLASAGELRDLIKGWMLSGRYSTGDATEQGQVNILGKLGDIATILEAIKLKEVDLSQVEPSRIDESNPYMIFRGWHKGYGFIDGNEWAIEGIRRDGDDVIHEWAFGTQKQIYAWLERLNYQYYPYGHELPVEGALPVEGGQ